MSADLLHDGWLRPPGASRAPALLPLGTLGSRGGAVVDGCGLVTPDGPGGRWSVDWWVAAEDRWHVPATEATVRQVLLDDSPVVETRVRVPGGDVAQLVYAYLAPDGSERVAIEVANDSAVPVAIAVVIRPYGPDGTGLVHEVGLTDQDTVVTVDGEPVLRLPRKPAGAAWSAGDGADIVAVVTDGSAPAIAPPPAGHRDDAGRATAAFVLPLPHRQSARFTLGGGPSGEPVPEALQVANGWAAQADRGARIELPDPTTATALAVARRRLVLWGADAALAPAFDALGLHDEAEEVLAALALPDTVFGADAEPPAAYLVAIDAHRRLAGSRALVEASADSIVAAASALVAANRRGWRRAPEPDARSAAGMAAAARLFASQGDQRAAADASRLAEALGPVPVPGPPSLDRGPAAPGSSFEELRAATAATISWIRSLVVDDAADGGLDLLPGWTPAWYGQGVEVHDLPTAAGVLSFAVRWHGRRPALLWELATRTEGASVRLRATALDPTWSSADGRGEALLEQVEPPVDHDPVTATEPDGAATSAQPPLSVWSIGPTFDPTERPRGDEPPDGGGSFT